MPSGHAQNVIYSTIFVYFALKDVKITIFYAIISLLTMYQRIKYKNHSVIQVIVGAIMGAFIGYSFYIYARKTMAGKLKGRDDDNAPI
jgi:membrane-associated phospholipid phosphatase